MSGIAQVFAEDDGWYFWDETETEKIGPFEEETFARYAMDLYGRYLDILIHRRIIQMSALDAANTASLCHVLKRALEPVIKQIAEDNLFEPVEDVRRKINEAILPYFSGTPLSYETAVEQRSIYTRVSMKGAQVMELRLDIACTEES